MTTGSAYLPDTGDPLGAAVEARLRAWSLTRPRVIARTAMALVLRVARRDGTPAVLKCLTATGRREEGHQAAVLRAFAGSGAVRVLAADDAAYLMEHCAGPDLLEGLDGADDAGAVRIAADVAARLHAARARRPEGVPTLAERCTALDRALPHAPGAARDLLVRARALADALLAGGAPPALLHGDLHHGNVLRADRPDGPRWVGIDPQGVWGDPAYEPANVFGNPINRPAISLDPDRPARVAAAFGAALGQPPRRLLGWAYVHCGLSVAWDLEDGEDPAHRIAVAERLPQVL